MIDLEFWEMNLLPYGAYRMVHEDWDDERHLRHTKNTLRNHRYLQKCFLDDNRRIARAIDLEERHLEYLQSQITWNEESIKNDDQSRKARAFAKNKRAEEKAVETEKGPLPGPQPITLGSSIPAAIILSIKYN